MDDPNGRYHIVEAPILAPGHDWVTKSADGPLIDTGVDIAFAATGRLYLSIETIRQMADVAGLFDSLVSKSETDETEVAREEGYGRGLKEAIVERLHDSLTELVGILAAATGDEPVAVIPLAALAGVELSIPTGGSGEESPAGNSIADKEPEPALVAAVDAGRQSNGNRRGRRPVSVSSDSGDGDNPFRV